MALAGKSKQDIVAEFRCAEILAAARKIFATKGFRDATVDDIAAEAGIAKGTVYLYYPSKKEMYLAALKQGLAELQQRTGAAMQAASGAQAKLSGRLCAPEWNMPRLTVIFSESITRSSGI